MIAAATRPPLTTAGMNLKKLGRQAGLRLLGMKSRTAVRLPPGTTGIFCVPPALVLVVLAPPVMTIWMSFHDWPLLGRAACIGLHIDAGMSDDVQA